MPTKSEPHDPSKPAPTDKPEPKHSKRAKPSFALPEDAGSATTAQGWVYRESEGAPAAGEHHADEPPVQEGSNTKTDPSVVGAMAGVLILGCTAVGLAGYALFRLLDIPVAAVRTVMPERRS